MTQVAIRIKPNSPITTSLQSDNLRSEARWERQVFEALLQAEWTTKVFSIYPIWKTQEPKHRKFIDELPKEEYKNTICLYQDYPQVMGFPGKFKGLIINSIGEGNSDFLKKEREDLKKEYGNNFFYTSGYFWPKQLKEMKEYIEDVEFLPYPAIQNKIKIDFPEERNIILWSRRGILGHLLNIDDVTQRPFRWIASQLKKHTSLEFHIVSAEESEGVDFELLFNSSRKYLLEFKNRIHIHKNLSWLEMQKLYLKTKIVINPKGFCFENGDIEASATGIPIVLDSSIEMSDPSFLIKEWNTSKYYDTLEQLLENKNFYLEKSRFYYNFVNKYHTYQSYTDNLYKILEQRKLV